MQELLKELWATYSVKDHCQPRAFIADVLLYDRLVIPIPPRKPDEVHEYEWKRWKSKGWDPALQERLLKAMLETQPVQEPVVETVEWDSQLQGEWKARMVAENQGGQLGKMLSWRQGTYCSKPDPPTRGALPQLEPPIDL